MTQLQYNTANCLMGQIITLQAALNKLDRLTEIQIIDLSACQYDIDIEDFVNGVISKHLTTFVSNVKNEIKEKLQHIEKEFESL